MANPARRNAQPNLAAAAEFYAHRLEWRVFPVHGIVNGRCTCGNPNCQSPGKHPIESNWRQRAITSPSQIATWWRQHPYANIALALPPGLLVVDIDPRNGGDDSLLTLPGFPDTVEALTGGGGRHIYLTYPPDRPKPPAKLAPGIDIKASGGYVLLSPSLHVSERRYEWEASSQPTDMPIAEAPDWLLKRIVERKSAQRPEAPGTPLPPTQVEDIRQALAVIPADDREIWLKVGMALRSTGAGEQAYGLWDGWSQTSDKYDPEDQWRVWNSLNSEGITLNTLFHRASEEKKRRGGTDSIPDEDETANRETPDFDAGVASDEAQAEPWPDLIPLDSRAREPLPLGVFTGWLGDMVEAVALATETPRELSAMTAVAVLGACCQGKLVIQPEPGYVEPLNIWTVAALDSGNRKTAVQLQFTAPLYDWERAETEKLKPAIARAKAERAAVEERIKQTRSKYARAKHHELEGLKYELLELESKLPEIPPIPRIVAQDITPEHAGTVMAECNERLAILSDEGGIFDILAGRYSRGVPNLDLFLQAHAGAPVRVDRGSRPPVHMQRPALTIGLSPQPDVLRGLAAQPGFRGRGLLARFLYTLPRSQLGNRSLEPNPVPDSVDIAYRAAVTGLLSMPAPSEDNPHTLKLSSQA